MILIWITLLLEVASIELNNPHLKQFIDLNKIVNIIGFSVTPCILFVGHIFCVEWVNRYQKERIKINYILLVPIVINGLGALMSYNRNILFYITNENVYKRGPLFFILPTVSYIFFIYNLYFIYKQRNKLTTAEITMFSCFFIVPAILTGIQIKYYIYLTTWNSAAIVTVIAYIFILNDQSNRDSMTGLENRLSYEQYSQNISGKKLNKLFMIYLDIDNFKDINDKCGHNEGDEAIKTFANLLLTTFSLRRKKIIRLGGDEFLILLENQQEKQVKDYIDKLYKCVEEYNDTKNKSYKLNYSYGMAKYTNCYENINQLLEHTDQLMYEQKQRVKKIL